MRYIGNKTKLLTFIEDVLVDNGIESGVFCDLFGGTGSVGDNFKGKFRIIANDYMYYAFVLNSAKLLNGKEPKFGIFKDKYGESPIDYLNSKEYELKDDYFISKNYTPIGNRMYLTESNGIKIDGMRKDIEFFYKNGEITVNEYYYLLGALIESVTKVSNTTGTYQAYLKYWESRAKKDFKLLKIDMLEVDELVGTNKVYNENANKLAKEITGDVVYIDPPYTNVQYTTSYHLLETLVRDDSPDITGVTGRRADKEFSLYSYKKTALEELKNLINDLNFQHILVSYSNQGIIDINDMVGVLKEYADGNEVKIYRKSYRSYITGTNSKEINDKKGKLEELILYINKKYKLKG